MTDNISLNPVVNTINITQEVNTVAISTPGPQGPAGIGGGSPAGGNANEFLAKSSSANYDTKWTNTLVNPTITTNARFQYDLDLDYYGGYQLSSYGNEGQNYPNPTLSGSMNWGFSYAGLETGVINAVRTISVDNPGFFATGENNIQGFSALGSGEVTARKLHIHDGAGAGVNWEDSVFAISYGDSPNMDGTKAFSITASGNIKANSSSFVGQQEFYYDPAQDPTGYAVDLIGYGDLPGEPTIQNMHGLPASANWYIDVYGGFNGNYFYLVPNRGGDTAGIQVLNQDNSHAFSLLYGQTYIDKLTSPSVSFTNYVNLGPYIATGSVQYALNAGSADFATTAIYAASSGMTEQVHVYGKNTSGSAMTKGQAVYISGAQGSHVTFALAQANMEFTSSKTLGVLEQDLAINAFGYVATDGSIDGVVTNGAVSGDPIWLSPTVPGGLVYGVANKPLTPYHMVYIGVVKRASTGAAANGALFIHVQNGFQVDELHDVVAVNPNNKDILQYNSTSGLWIAQAGSVSYATKSGSADYATNAGNSTTTSQTSFSTLSVTDGITTGGNINVGGSLYVSGSTVAISASNLTLNDPLLYLADGNPANVNDIGIVGSFTPGASNTYQHTGLVRDASDNTWKLFSGVTPEPTNTVDFTSASWDNLQAGRITLNPSSSTGLTIKPVTGGNSQVWQDTNGTSLTRINEFAQLGVRTNGGFYNAALAVNSNFDSIVGIAIRANSGTQSADMLQLQNSAGSVLSTINASGQLVVGSAVPIVSTSAAMLSIYQSSSNMPGIIVRRPVDVGTANMQEWQSPTGGITTYIDSSGRIITKRSIFIDNNQSNTTVPFNLTNAGSAVATMVINNAAGQTADIIRLRDSSNNILTAFNALGQLIVGSAVALTTTSGSPSMLSIYNSSSNVPGISIKTTSLGTGAAANILEAKDINASVVFALDGAYRLWWNDSLSSPIIRWGNSNIFTGGTQPNGNIWTPYNNLRTALIARGLSGQSVDIFQVQDSNASVLFTVNQSGNVTVGSALPIVSSSPAMISVYTTASTVPGIIIRYPTNAGSSQEIFKIENSNGTRTFAVNNYSDTIISNAYFGQYQTAGPNNSRVYMWAGNNNTTPLSLLGHTAQTADLLQLKANSGSILSAFNASGQLIVGSALPIVSGSNAMLSVYAAASTVPGLIIKSASLQTANLQEWHDAAGTVLASIYPSGTLYATGRIISGIDHSARLNINTIGSNVVGAIIRGVSGQTADLTRWQDSNGSALFVVNASGQLIVGSSQPLVSTSAAMLSIYNSSSNTPGIIVRSTQQSGAGAGNLVELWDNNSSKAFVVNSGGRTQIRTNNTDFNSALSIQTGNAGATGITIRGVSSQSSNLQEWQNNAGASVAAVDPFGNITASGNVVYNQATNAQTGASYTLVLSDSGKFVERNNAGLNYVIIPSNANASFPTGARIDIIQTGAGGTVFSASTGVTLNFYSPTSATTASVAGQWAGVTLVKRATDTWAAIGNIK